MNKIIKSKEGIVFRQIEVPENKLPCDFCPYGDKLCDLMEDPLKRSGYSFLDYCNDMSKISEFSNAVPVEGTIENKSGGDLVKKIISIDPIVRVNRVIDTVCPDFCDLYDKEHSQCNSGNSLCILKKIFI